MDCTVGGPGVLVQTNLSWSVTDERNELISPCCHTSVRYMGMVIWLVIIQTVSTRDPNWEKCWQSGSETIWASGSQRKCQAVSSFHRYFHNFLVGACASLYKHWKFAGFQQNQWCPNFDKHFHKNHFHKYTAWIFFSRCQCLPLAPPSILVWSE